jgi:hypothetical protein
METTEDQSQKPLPPELKTFVVVQQVTKGQIKNPSEFNTRDEVITDSLKSISDNGKLYVFGENHEYLFLVGDSGKVIALGKSTPAYLGLVKV